MIDEWSWEAQRGEVRTEHKRSDAAACEQEGRRQHYERACCRHTRSSGRLSERHRRITITLDLKNKTKKNRLYLQKLSEQDEESQAGNKVTTEPHRGFALLFTMCCRLIINYSSWHFPHAGKESDYLWFATQINMDVYMWNKVARKTSKRPQLHFLNFLPSLSKTCFQLIPDWQRTEAVHWCISNWYFCWWSQVKSIFSITLPRNPPGVPLMVPAKCRALVLRYSHKVSSFWGWQPLHWLQLQVRYVVECWEEQWKVHSGFED